MENTFLWAFIIGLCAMSFSIAAWQLKNPRHVILCYVPSGTLWAIQYALLGAPLGVMMNAFSVVKDGSLAFLQDKYVPFIIGAFLIATWLFGLYFMQYWYDIIPLIGGSIINIALLQRDNRPLIARATIAGQVCWITYNIIVGSWAGMLCGIFVIISSLIGMYRYENWDLQLCFKNFVPSLYRSLVGGFIPRTYP